MAEIKIKKIYFGNVCLAASFASLSSIKLKWLMGGDDDSDAKD